MMYVADPLLFLSYSLPRLPFSSSFTQSDTSKRVPFEPGPAWGFLPLLLGSVVIGRSYKKSRDDWDT